jgi:hypothetical protein
MMAATGCAEWEDWKEESPTSMLFMIAPTFLTERVHVASMILCVIVLHLTGLGKLFGQLDLRCLTKGIRHLRCPEFAYSSLHSDSSSLGTWLCRPALPEPLAVPLSLLLALLTLFDVLVWQEGLLRALVFWDLLHDALAISLNSWHSARIPSSMCFILSNHFQNSTTVWAFSVLPLHTSINYVVGENSCTNDKNPR